MEDCIKTNPQGNQLTNGFTKYTIIHVTVLLTESSVVPESRTRGGDRLGDPDYTLIVRVEDLAGASENALSGITSVKVEVEQNLWVNPGPLTVREHLKADYPMVIAKVGAGWVLGGCWVGFSRSPWPGLAPYTSSGSA